MAGGGQSGYLVSDAGKNWLTGSEAKRLTGYPLDAPAPLDRQRKLQSFGLFTSPLAAVAGAPGVFTTGAFRSTGGNSGGALNVRFNNIVFYPAGIYLGGTGQSVVRVIDRDVVDLINRAELTANTGDNNSSGGVPRSANEEDPKTFTDGGGEGAFKVAFSGAPVGAGYRITGASTSYKMNPIVEDGRDVGIANNEIEFAPVAGYLMPGRYQVPVLANRTQMVSVVYARVLANHALPLLAGGEFGFVVSAASFGRIALYGQTAQGLSHLSPWILLTNYTLNSKGTNFLVIDPRSTPYQFFRTQYLTNP